MTHADLLDVEVGVATMRAGIGMASLAEPMGKDDLRQHRAYRASEIE